MLVSLLLARLLAPETFGIVASVMIFLTMARNLIDGGIGSRIVQKPDVQDEDYTALFWCNAVVSLTICALLIVFSDAIAVFYGDPRLITVVRAMAVATFFMTCGRVQQCQMIREFRFRTNALISVVSVSVGSTAGVVIALMGGGVWAILGQQLVLSIVQAIILWVVLPWRPRHLPQWKYVKDLYAFGMPVMTSQTIRSGAEQALFVCTAKIVGMTSLGFLDRGCFIPANVCMFLQHMFFRTNYAILSRVQSEPHAFRAAYIRLMGMMVALLLSGMGALFICAPDVIEVLIGAKWLPSTRLFQAGCVMSSLNLLFYVHIDVLKAIGQVGKVFRQNAIYAILEVAGVLIGLAWSMPGMVLGVIIARLISGILLAYTVSHNSSITISVQLRVFAWPIVWAIITMLLVGSLRCLDIVLWARFILCALSGVVMVGGCWLLNGKLWGRESL